MPEGNPEAYANPLIAAYTKRYGSPSPQNADMGVGALNPALSRSANISMGAGNQPDPRQEVMQQVSQQPQQPPKTEEELIVKALIDRLKKLSPAAQPEQVIPMGGQVQPPSIQA